MTEKEFVLEAYIRLSCSSDERGFLLDKDSALDCAIEMLEEAKERGLFENEQLMTKELNVIDDVVHNFFSTGKEKHISELIMDIKNITDIKDKRIAELELELLLIKEEEQNFEL